MLRDDQIVDILQLVDFRISKAELGAFFRNPDHPNYMECGDQVLRNFLNGLVIHLRGTKENPKNPQEVLGKPAVSITTAKTKTTAAKPASKPQAKKPMDKKKPPVRVVENVKFNNGKDRKKK